MIFAINMILNTIWLIGFEKYIISGTDLHIL